MYLYMVTRQTSQKHQAYSPTYLVIWCVDIIHSLEQHCHVQESGTYLLPAISRGALSPGCTRCSGTPTEMCSETCCSAASPVVAAMHRSDRSSCQRSGQSRHQSRLGFAVVADQFPCPSRGHRARLPHGPSVGMLSHLIGPGGQLGMPEGRLGSSLHACEQAQCSAPPRLWWSRCQR